MLLFLDLYAEFVLLNRRPLNTNNYIRIAGLLGICLEMLRQRQESICHSLWLRHLLRRLRPLVMWLEYVHAAPVPLNSQTRARSS